MKENKRLFWVVSVMLMVLTLYTLNGCSLGGETIPKNRTKDSTNLKKRLNLYLNF